MRDRVPVGASATKALASFGGNETPTTSTVADHSHAVNGGTLFEAMAVEASSYGGLSSGGAVSSVAQNAGGHSHTVSSMQPYRAINFIIKY
jgi:microcystin-dependent protein